jgi:hypothetical protein
MSSSSPPGITSTWEFHRSTDAAEQLLLITDGITGAIVNSTLNGVPINGTIDASLNVSFNDAQFPGEVLQVTFYTGMVFPLNSWAPNRTFMGGTFQETEVIVTGGIGGQQPLPVNAPPASTATAPAATAMTAATVDTLAPAVGSGPPSVQATTVRGPWYAILRFLGE